VIHLDSLGGEAQAVLLVLAWEMAFEIEERFCYGIYAITSVTELGLQA
jgi:hypothetical protein